MELLTKVSETALPSYILVQVKISNEEGGVSLFPCNTLSMNYIIFM